MKLALMALLTVFLLGNVSAHAGADLIIIAVSQQPAAGVPSGGVGITSIRFDTLEKCQNAESYVPGGTNPGMAIASISHFCVSADQKKN